LISKGKIRTKEVVKILNLFYSHSSGISSRMNVVIPFLEKILPFFFIKI
jgi:hypothetical protein